MQNEPNFFNLLSTVIILVILYLYNIRTSKLRLCWTEVAVSSLPLDGGVWIVGVG